MWLDLCFLALPGSVPCLPFIDHNYPTMAMTLHSFTMLTRCSEPDCTEDDSSFTVTDAQDLVVYAWGYVV